MERKTYISIVVALILLSTLVVACGSSDSSGSLAIGSDAPAFELLAADGSRVELDDYQGKPVLLYFHMAMG